MFESVLSSKTGNWKYVHQYQEFTNSPAISQNSIDSIVEIEKNPDLETRDSSR